MKLNDFNNLTNFGITDPRMTTIGGVAFRHLDRLPHEGDKVVIDDVTITVLAMDGHRIAKVRVAKQSIKDEEEIVEQPLENLDSASESEANVDTHKTENLPTEEPLQTENSSPAEQVEMLETLETALETEKSAQQEDKVNEALDDEANIEETTSESESKKSESEKAV